MCQQTLLRFCISLRATFWNWVAFKVISKYARGAAIHISRVFRPCYLLKGPLKWDFLDIYLTTFFGVHKFKNTSAMRVMFSLKMFKNESKFQKCKKKSKKFFCFLDNCIWKCCNKLPLLRSEYFSSTVNCLTNSPKILHITQSYFFNLNCIHRDQ